MAHGAKSAVGADNLNTFKGIVMRGFVLIGKFRDILDALALLARIERVNYHLLGLLWGKMLNLNRNEEGR